MATVAVRLLAAVAAGLVATTVMASQAPGAASTTGSRAVSGQPARPAIGGAVPASKDLWPTISNVIDGARQQYRVAGVAVAVVQDGLVTTRGFGDRGPGSAALDPSTARVHIASVTKLITSLAVLQLAESGGLALDVPIERYLDGALRQAFDGRGITLRHLLTHTSGIADRWVGIAASTPEAVQPLSVYLTANLPPILDRPGRLPRYSNYGYGLAGHIAERVSGVPYAAHVTARILRPLGMSHSYVGPRAPDDLDVRGLFYREAITPEPFVFEHLVPAGGVHATVGDLGTLVGAVLAAAEDRADPSGPISALMAQTLLDLRDASSRQVAGWGLGLFPLRTWTDAAWVAGGEVPGLSTRILLVPSRRLGVVVAVSRKDPTLATLVFESVLRQVSMPAPARTAVTPGVNRFAGVFRATLDDPSTFMHVASIFSPTLRVTSDAERTPSLAVTFQNANREADVWHLTAGDVLISRTAGIAREVGEVQRDETGRVVRVILADREAGPVAFARVPWWGQAETTLLAVLAAALISIAGLLWSVRRPRRRATVLITALLNLCFVGGVASGIAQLAVLHDDRFAFGVPAWFIAVLWIPPLSSLVFAWACIRAPELVRGLAAGGRALLACHLTATLALLLLAAQWRLFGPHL